MFRGKSLICKEALYNPDFGSPKKPFIFKMLSSPIFGKAKFMPIKFKYLQKNERKSGYKNNYKVLFTLILILPLYWVILGVLFSLQKGGDPAYGAEFVLYPLFLLIAGLVTFRITILPVRLQDKFIAIILSIALGLGVLFLLEGENILDLLFWDISWMFLTQSSVPVPFGLVCFFIYALVVFVCFGLKYFFSKVIKKRDNLES